MKPTRTKARRAETAPGITLSTSWAAALLALLVVLFFHQVALEGQTFVAPDATAPVGFVRVGEQALYHDHVYPLWNPFVFLGMPSFGSGAYNPLIYPPDWPLALLNRVVPLPEMTWLLLYYLLGGLFFFLLAREHGARPEGGLLGAVAFLFAPNLIAVGSHGHGSQLVCSAYLPLLLWLAARWMRRGGIHHLGWLALAGGFQMLRGHAQIAFYTWFAVGLYVAVNVVLGSREASAREASFLARIARAAGVVGAMALAFGLAGFFNLPLRDYAQYSIRGGGADGGVGMQYATAWSLGPWELPAVVVPGWAGFGGATYWGGMPFTDYPNAYMGLVAVALAIPALLAWSPARIWAVALAAASIAIAFGRYFPLYGFLYDHLPLFNKFRVPAMILVLFQLATALSFAWGWSGLLEGGPQGKGSGRAPRLMMGLAIALAVALVAGLVGQEGFRSAYEAMARAHQPQLSAGAVSAAYRGFIGDLVRVSLLGLLAVGLGVLALRRRIPASLASLGVLALLLIELWPVSSSVMAPVIGPRVPNPLEQGRDDVVDFLEKAGPAGTFRVLPITESEFRSNRLAGFAVATLGGYHAAKPRLYQDLVEAHAIENPIWLRLLNVRYILTPEPIQDPGFHPAYQGSALLYEFPAALPRATLVASYGLARGGLAAIDSVSSGRRDPATFTWLEKDPGLSLGPITGATATIARYRLNDVTVETDSPGPALLRLADLWYPDWIALVDGRPAEILRADHALRAVPVPAGRHRVEFRYRSPAIRRGLLLSLASLAGTLVLLAAGYLARRRGGGATEAVT
jgi:hypothetical protein